MVVGIDIDDTISETTLEAFKYLREFNVECSNHHDLPKVEYDSFMGKYMNDIVTNCAIKEGVQEAFEYLNNHGYKIMIITARNNKYSESVKELTLKYLAKYNLKYEQIVFGKEEMGMTAKNLGVEIFIDDKESVLDNIAKYNIECIRITRDENSKYKTFSKWSDILEYLKTRR